MCVSIDLLVFAANRNSDIKSEAFFIVTIFLLECRSVFFSMYGKNCSKPNTKSLNTNTENLLNIAVLCMIKVLDKDTRLRLG
jgi:hypothetical protein